MKGTVCNKMKRRLIAGMIAFVICFTSSTAMAGFGSFGSSSGNQTGTQQGSQTNEESTSDEPVVEEEPAVKEEADDSKGKGGFGVRVTDPDFVIVKNVLKAYNGSDAHVVVPKKVTEIGKGAFAGNEDLVSVAFAGSVESIGAGAFEGCINLKTVKFADADALVKIESRAFADCEKLDYAWSEEVESVASDAFAGCESEPEDEEPVADNEAATEDEAPVVDNEAVTEDEVPAADNEAATEDEAPVADNEAATEDEAPVTDNEAATEDEETVADNEAVTEDEVPAADNEAATENEEPVADNEAVTENEEPVTGDEVAPETKEPVADDETGAEESDEDADEEVVEEIVEDESDFIIDGNVLTSYTGTDVYVVVPEDVTFIGAGAFANNVNLVAITFDGAVVEVGSGAFDGCINLEIVRFADVDELEKIGSRAFAGCEKLDYSWAEGASDVASDAFAGCELAAEETEKEASSAVSGGFSTPRAAAADAVITQQPSDYTGTSGNAVFTVEVTGDNLTYQWQYRTSATSTKWIASPATGATTASVSIPIAKYKDGYQYRCVITDASGNTVTSSAATLNYGTPVEEPENPDDTSALKIVTQPVDYYGTTGNAAFTVEATGEGLTYQWQYRTSATSTKWIDSPATGATTASVAIAIAKYKNGYQYRCVIMDSNGNSVTTDVATLVYGSAADNPDETVELKITAQPADFTGMTGNAVFTVAATGDSLTYQWQYRTSATATKWSNSPATGNKTERVSIAIAQYKDGYQYRCVITDGYGNSVTSDAATLIYGASDVTEETKLEITSQPHDFGGTSGNAVFTVVATGDGLTYQWEYRTGSDAAKWSNSPATGNKTASVSIPIAKYKDGYQYRCVIIDSHGNTVTSEHATLVYGDAIVPDENPLTITSQPADFTGTSGNAIFTVEATGNGLTYQWQYRTSAAATKWSNSPATGNNTASVSIPIAKYKNGYQYCCVITDSNGVTVTSDVATLIYGSLVEITTQPADCAAFIGTDAVFTIAASGDSLTYQWQYRESADAADWTNCTDGAAESLTIVAAAELDGYQYQCVVTNGTGATVTSNVATLTVTDTFVVDGITYKVTEGTNVEVSAYSGSSSSVTIPATVNGYNVIRVGEAAFEGNTALTSIDLPDTIQTIGKRAFANCTNLASVD